MLSFGCATLTAASRSKKVSTPEYVKYSNFETLPHWKAKQNVNSVFTKQQVSNYFNFFADEWVREGLSSDRSVLVAAFNNIEIHWQKYIFVQPNESERLLGLTIPNSFGYVIVFVYDYSKERRTDLGFTALGHELIHIALLATEGDIQPTHCHSITNNWAGKYKILEDTVNLKFIN